MRNWHCLGLAVSVLVSTASALANQPLTIVDDLPPEQAEEPLGPPNQVVFDSAMRALMTETHTAFWEKWFDPAAPAIELTTPIISDTDLPQGYLLFDNEIAVFTRLYQSRILQRPAAERLKLRAVLNADPAALQLFIDYTKTYEIKTDPAIHGADIHDAHRAMIADATANLNGLAIEGTSGYQDGFLRSTNLMTSKVVWMRPVSFIYVPTVSVTGPANGDPNNVVCIARAVRLMNEYMQQNPSVAFLPGSWKNTVLFKAWVVNHDRLCREEPMFSHSIVLMGQTSGDGWEMQLSNPQGNRLNPDPPAQIGCGNALPGVWPYKITATVKFVRSINHEISAGSSAEAFGLGIQSSRSRSWKQERLINHQEVMCVTTAGCKCG